ncbi:LacI family DNA-binding transcriptional regulator [Kitasatospora nipponensis]|uniref:LacI family DNA-binding transcriptional regulator n=1 Tax=Kitasatospora nipponensis TaxID=258049 RepID=UPI0031D7390A
MTTTGQGGGRRPPGLPTIKDVAEHVGVSFKTVSRVVNGDGKVSAQTAQRVRQAVEELGYVRNESARQLRRGRTGTVALLVRAVSDPFFAAICDAAAERARDHDLAVFVTSTHDRAERERELATAMAGRRPDGLVITPIAESQDYLQGVLDSGIPVVAIDRPARGIQVDAVLADNAGGVRDAVEHLLRHGHSRIGYLGDAPEIFTARERVAGFRSTAEVHGLGLREEEIDLARPDDERIATLLRRWRAAPDPVTALVTGNNAITMAALRELVDEPHPPALVGFDDFELADLVRPAVSVVAQDPAAVGRTAIDLLVERLRQPERPVRTIRVQTRLIPRGSGELTVGQR